VKFLSVKKEAAKAEKKEIEVLKKKAPASVKPQKKATAIAPAKSTEISQGFDDVFDKFRSDFQNLLLPSTKALEKALSSMPTVRAPVIDLQDCGKEYILKAEMPGFKKEDVEVNVYDDAVEISGTAGWKYDKKGERYICKERACETFYRVVPIPQEIKVEEANAELKDGVLELNLPKKTPKQTKKVSVK
jgi:HSP20 family protein